MPPDALSPWLARLVPGLLALLCSHVMLECRARLAESVRAGDADRWQWLAGAALAMGTGAWSLHINHVMLQPLDFAVHYDTAWLTVAWAASVALAALGVWASVVLPGAALAWGAGALLTTAAALLASIIALLAVRFQPGLPWAPGGLGLAALSMALPVALALWLRDRRAHGWTDTGLRLASSLLLATGLWLAESQLVASASLPQQTGSAVANGVSLNALGLLAKLGTLVLLLMTLVISRRETSMRASLVQARHDVERESLTDPLTRLPNRQAFEHRLREQAADTERDRSSMALLFIDIDGFKPINESFGHASGDWLLNAVGQRLGQDLQAPEFLARWGADQFLLLLPATRSREVLAARARALLQAIAEPMEVQGRELPVQASIGLALCPDDGAAAMLVAHADAATHAAKAAGGGTFCFFEPHMLTDSREQMELLRDLRKAIDEQELELYFQPKIHAPSGEITGAEALIRWNHPSKGLISPAAFIPVAERFGLIGAVGNWVIDQACRQIHEWREGGLRMRVAINLSVHQLRQDDLAERIAAALKRYEVNPTLLTCEITESVAMENNATSKAFFDKLEGIGVHISIDDFGTGYSSLAYLRQLPAEELKIDAGFVKDLEFSNDARTVVEAVVKLGLALGLKVVAEGVETDVQRDILRQLGCNELQGFLFAKPMAAKRLYLWAMSDDGPANIDFRQSLFGDTQIPDDLAGEASAR
ncbi:putative bifunctional diguanylate cyclase/phosphodiesterase [Hydrogenophaga sp. OTU3427]|uniref:putative bifunctional diguanylate cyclase/phosphodiesterase n=1 Tax=Hydrogenophaga sp. OTU3427 TaxID=3043856 RepID=UPI00313B54A8